MSSSHPIYSMITVTYNSIKFIATMLDSALNQQLDATYEVIVVDNGSIDGTPDFIKENYPTVNLIQSTNTGFGQGNNLGVQHAKGQYIAFINPDTELDVFCLNALMKPLLKENVVTTAKILLQKDKKTINTCGNHIHFSAYGFVNGYKNLSDTHQHVESVDGISGAAFAISKVQFDRLGGFDKSFFLYCEDTEFSWRCKRDGMDIVFIPDSIVYHDYELRLSPQKIYYLEFGRWSVLKKYYSKQAFFILLPSLLIADLLSWAYALKYGSKGLKMKAKAFVDALNNPVTEFSTAPVVGLNGISQTSIPFKLIWKNPFVLILGAGINLFFQLNFKLYKIFSKR